MDTIDQVELGEMRSAQWHSMSDANFIDCIACWDGMRYIHNKYSFFIEVSNKNNTTTLKV